MENSLMKLVIQRNYLDITLVRLVTHMRAVRCRVLLLHKTYVEINIFNPVILYKNSVFIRRNFML